jgi:hypothetical protein
VNLFEFTENKCDETCAQPQGWVTVLCNGRGFGGEASTLAWVIHDPRRKRLNHLSGEASVARTIKALCAIEGEGN